MKRVALIMAAALVASTLAAAAQEKTLVFCPEGSPEGFDPAPWTSGTTFDASARTIYNRLVEFTPGTTNIEPGLAES
jgi:dipeptide transport system substrate-binding protein